MSFTWFELVGISVINYLKDPELVLYFLKILKKERRNMLECEARKYHIQNTPHIKKFKKQWYKLTTLEKENCDKHFDLMRKILFLQEGFLLKDYGDGMPIDAPIMEKLRVVNLIYDESDKGINCRGQYSLEWIEEALSDYGLFDDGDIDLDYPYLLIMGESNNYYIDIIN